MLWPLMVSVASKLNLCQEGKMLGSPVGETARWMMEVLVLSFSSRATRKKRWLWRS